MNEGWASIWHAPNHARARPQMINEHIEFANLHSGVVSPHKGQLNPYYLGYKIYEDIERRWNNPSIEEQKDFGRKVTKESRKSLKCASSRTTYPFLRNYLTERAMQKNSTCLYLNSSREEEWTDH